MKAKTIGRKEYRELIRTITNARKAERIKQVDLAKRLGWSQPEVSKYEHYVRRLDMVEFVDICDALGLDYKELVDSVMRKDK